MADGGEGGDLERGEAALVYKANFANFTAANGWLTRAERLVGPGGPGKLRACIGLVRL